MFKRLRNKLLFINMVILTVVMLTAFGIIYAITYSNIQHENGRKLDTLPNMAFNEALPVEAITEQVPTIRGYAGLPLDYAPSFVVTVNEAGEVQDILTHMSISEDVCVEAARDALESGRMDGRMRIEGRSWQYRIVSMESIQLRRNIRGNYFIADNQIKIAFLDITDTNKTLASLLITFMIVGVVMLGALFLISFWFASRSIRPLEESWIRQKQFVADASHELKTPLAIIGANMDALRANKEETIESQEKWLGYIGDEIGRMGKLVNDLLYLTKAENVSGSAMTVDLVKVVEEAVASMEAVVYEKGVQVEVGFETDVIVRGDADRIKQAVLIFLDNAAKYTEEDGTIEVFVAKTRSHAIFSVKNSGPMIPKEDLEKIFDRFYRCDESRSQETGGYGLGLAIAKAIVEREGGEIVATSEDGVTEFRVQLRLF